MDKLAKLYLLSSIAYLIWDVKGAVAVLAFAFTDFIYQKMKYQKLAKYAIANYFSDDAEEVSDTYNNKLNFCAIDIARHKALLINYLKKDKLINTNLTANDFEDGFWAGDVFETDVDIYTESFLDQIEPLYYLYFYELKGKTPDQLEAALAKAKLESKPAIDYYFSEYEKFAKKSGVRPAHPYWIKVLSEA